MSTNTPNLTSLLEENPHGWGARTIAYGQFLAERWAGDRPVAEWVRELADFENAQIACLVDDERRWEIVAAALWLRQSFRDIDMPSPGHPMTDETYDALCYLSSVIDLGHEGWRRSVGVGEAVEELAKRDAALVAWRGSQ